MQIIMNEGQDLGDKAIIELLPEKNKVATALLVRQTLRGMQDNGCQFAMASRLRGDLRVLLTHKELGEAQLTRIVLLTQALGLKLYFERYSGIETKAGLN